MGDIVFHMKKGEQVCERYVMGNICLKPAKDYKRNAREKRGWPVPTQPIALCDEHAEGHELIKVELIK